MRGTKKRGLWGLLLAGSAFALGGATGAPDTASSDDQRCTAMAAQSFGADVRILSATRVPALKDEAGSAVPHCRIEGIINERKGAGGKEYGIRFAIALPDNWTGRFLLQGGGGLNGTVHPPLGPVAAGDTPALARGFAVISHDSGHEGAVFDPSFMVDQRAALDFAETSVLTVAQLGKRITRAYYGKDINYSYMTGCSTGGREGMLASQRYPELFDGIIVGAPAMRAQDSNLGGDYTKVLLNQIAPQDEAGKPDINGLLTPAVRKTLLDGILKQCDALDGLADGMIENVAQCNFQPKKLQCEGSNPEGCLSPKLVAALDKGFAGPFDKAEDSLYAPVPYDTGIVEMQGGYLPNGAPGPLGPPYLATEIDLDARIHAIRNDAANRLTDTNYWTNLNTFLDHGGKMLFFHGVSDFWFSPWATWDWYERAAATNGAAFTDASRFYMVPGMMHCRGGNSFDNFDMLSALIDWVEANKAPAAITAFRKEPKPASRPLCPYPAYARYQGGNARSAGSFTCIKPE